MSEQPGEQLEKNENTFDNLRVQLESAGIVTAEWGKGQAKTLEHLSKEIESGETVLVTNEAGELLRRVIVGGGQMSDILLQKEKVIVSKKKNKFLKTDVSDVGI